MSVYLITNLLKMRHVEHGALHGRNFSFIYCLYFLVIHGTHCCVLNSNTTVYTRVTPSVWLSRCYSQITARLHCYSQVTARVYCYSQITARLRTVVGHVTGNIGSTNVKTDRHYKLQFLSVLLHPQHWELGIKEDVVLPQDQN